MNEEFNKAIKEKHLAIVIFIPYLDRSNILDSEYNFNFE